MVLLGGLEIVAAGYLLNEFNDNKKEQRAARRHRRDSDGKHHSSSRPSSSRPSVSRPSQSLQVPIQGPPRPSSAPPNSALIPPGPPGWQTPPQQQPPQQRPPPQQNPGLPPAANPYLAQLQNDRPPPRLQHPNSFPQQMRPPPPQQQQPFQAPPPGPLTYVDSKTGKVQHNMYPPNHPLARGLAATYFDDSNVELKRAEFYSSTEGSMSQPGGKLSAPAGRNRSRSTDDRGLAYGKFYPKGSSPLALDHVPSYERERRRRRS